MSFEHPMFSFARGNKLLLSCKTPISAEWTFDLHRQTFSWGRIRSSFRWSSTVWPKTSNIVNVHEYIPLLVAYIENNKKNMQFFHEKFCIRFLVFPAKSKQGIPWLYKLNALRNAIFVERLCLTLEKVGFRLRTASARSGFAFSWGSTFHFQRSINFHVGFFWTL